MKAVNPETASTAQFEEAAKWMRRILEARDVDEAFAFVEWALKGVEEFIKQRRSTS